MYTSFPSNIFIVPDSSLGRVWGFGVNGPRFKPRWSSFLSILWVFRFHNFMSKMSQESQVNLNFADYDKLGLRLSAISISPQSEERQVWPVGCPRAGCKIGRRQKWQRRLILKNQTVCFILSQTARSAISNFSFLVHKTDKTKQRISSCAVWERMNAS